MFGQSGRFLDIDVSGVFSGVISVERTSTRAPDMAGSIFTAIGS